VEAMESKNPIKGRTKRLSLRYGRKEIKFVAQKTA